MPFVRPLSSFEFPLCLDPIVNQIGSHEFPRAGACVHHPRLAVALLSDMQPVQSSEFYRVVSVRCIVR